MSSSTPKIYFDSCCFIDMAKHTVSAGVMTAPRISHVYYLREFLKFAKTGGAVVYASTLSVAECTHVTDDTNPSEHKKIMTDEVKRLFEGMLLSGKSGVISIQPSYNIVKAARDFRWMHDVRKLEAYDAVHVATALSQKCDYFLTTDGPLKDSLKDICAAQGMKFATADAIKNLLPSAPPALKPAFVQTEIEIPHPDLPKSSGTGAAA